MLRGSLRTVSGLQLLRPLQGVFGRRGILFGRRKPKEPDPAPPAEPSVDMHADHAVVETQRGLFAIYPDAKTPPTMMPVSADKLDESGKIGVAPKLARKPAASPEEILTLVDKVVKAEPDDATARKDAFRVSEVYRHLSHEQQMSFLVDLAQGHPATVSDLLEAKKDIVEAVAKLEDLRHDEGAEIDTERSNLQSIISRGVARFEPGFTRFFRVLKSHDDDGLLRVMEMRGHTLDYLSELDVKLKSGPERASIPRLKASVAALKALEQQLQRLFEDWFTIDQLAAVKVTTKSTDKLKKKVVAGEKVHPLASIEELDARLGTGRRCYALVHKSMPREILVFVMVALTREIASGMVEILGQEGISPELAGAAMFYSINRVQRGLQKIDLGNVLIKKAAELIKDELNINTFSTLSPIPGFGRWLEQHIEIHIMGGKTDPPLGGFIRPPLLLDSEARALLRLHRPPPGRVPEVRAFQELLQSQWHHDPDLEHAMKAPLMRLCALYLTTTGPDKKVLDSVANFHLGNGALIHRINWLGDTSRRGMKQSGGMMVNYLYDIDKTEKLQKDYADKHIIAIADSVKTLSQISNVSPVPPSRRKVFPPAAPPPSSL